MTHDTQPDRLIGRRSMLKTTGITLSALGGLTGAVAGKGGGNGKGRGRQPLEDSSSRVEFTIFPGQGTAFPGFPVFPVIGGASGPGTPPSPISFDTTVPEITPNGNVIHFALRFVQGAFYVNEPKPYVITHSGDGRYVSKGAVVNFEVPEGDGNLLGGLLPAGKHRAAVRDEIQLYDNGYFDWAVTRGDFYKRGKGGLQYELSLVYVLWDEDGDDNDQELDRGDPIGSPPDDPASVPGFTLPTAQRLIGRGPLNPGGQ